MGRAVKGIVCEPGPTAGAEEADKEEENPSGAFRGVGAKPWNLVGDGVGAKAALVGEEG